MRFCCLSLFLIASVASAQNYPAKPVRIIAAYAPGGSIDIVARLLGQKLTEAYGQQFIVENRAGASGNIGTEYVAKAAPDGYTLLLAGSSPHVLNTYLFAKLPFDPVRDFSPIILVDYQSNVLVVHPSVPAANVKELIALAKSRPGKLTFGSAGLGATQHISVELLMSMAGINMVHVPYKGGAPATLDLVGGQIDVMIETTPSALQYVNSGRLKALGITSLQRSPMLPNVPTISEAGLPGYEFRSWMALVGPAGIPKEIVAKLNADVQKALNGDLRKRLEELGLQVAGGTPEELQALMKTELVKYGKIVRAAKITPQ